MKKIFNGKWFLIVFELIAFVLAIAHLFSPSTNWTTNIRFPFDTYSIRDFVVSIDFRPVIIFLLMLLGMFCCQVFANIDTQEKSGATKINVKQTFVDSFAGPSFWKAVVVCPIIFYAIYKIPNSEVNDLSGYVLAFQNGFFWKTMFTAKGG